WVAILANMLILYGLLTAYLTGGAKIIGDLLGVSTDWQWLLLLVFFAALTTLALLDNRLILRYNALIMLVMLSSFLLLVSISWRHVDSTHFAYRDWHYLPAAAPIIVTAFHFHNVIPNVCRNMDWNLGRIWKVMLVGMLLGFLMNMLWIQVGVGVLTMDDGPNGILTAFHENLPATVPMARIIGSRLFTVFSMAFALLAIVTSYLANGLGLQGFVRDMLENHCGVRNRTANAVLTFGPPLVISLVYPDVFLKALNVVGGVGIVILFGILPAVILLRKFHNRALRIAGWALLLLFSVCLVCEVLHETGLLRLHAHMEYWNPRH
ncbi:MAG: tryptophan/tyrosine permease, partial [Lentisphaerae bacterium]|nr:tryptophan/tyrosine permease [Lentisphaerota bacterium]